MAELKAQALEAGVHADAMQHHNVTDDMIAALPTALVTAFENTQTDFFTHTQVRHHDTAHAAPHSCSNSQFEVYQRVLALLQMDHTKGHLTRASHANFTSIWCLNTNEALAVLQTSGSTATVVVVCGWEVIVASVGDSLAYVDTGAEVVQVGTCFPFVCG